MPRVHFLDTRLDSKRLVAQNSSENRNNQRNSRKLLRVPKMRIMLCHQIRLRIRKKRIRRPSNPQITLKSKSSDLRQKGKTRTVRSR